MKEWGIFRTVIGRGTPNAKKKKNYSGATLCSTNTRTA
jgi:hypothetical protein